MSKAWMRSQVAQRAQVNPATIRYYERKGLLPKAIRTPAGYRLFGEQTIRQVRFIRRIQALGFSLAEIGELFALRAAPDGDCSEICNQVRRKLAVIDQKLVDLRTIRKALARVADNCDGKRTVRKCGALEALGMIENPPPASSKGRTE